MCANNYFETRSLFNHVTVNRIQLIWFKIDLTLDSVNCLHLHYEYNKGFVNIICMDFEKLFKV